MDIDTGDFPSIASKPYTLSLKHYDWVQKEITTLERAGIITKSISPWASPVVIVLKKSAPGESPQRRMCVDFRRLNKQLPEGKNMSGGKGCISLVPLPTRKPYGFMQSCSVLLPSQIHMTKFTPHLGYFFQFNQMCGKN